LPAVGKFDNENTVDALHSVWQTNSNVVLAVSMASQVE
jgi:hypothetical protein